jgi:hypothetical protein
VRHKYFEWFILTTIALSSFLLCWDTPRTDPNSDRGLALLYFDYIFCVIFTIEMVLKIVAWGLILGKVRCGAVPALVALSPCTPPPPNTLAPPPPPTFTCIFVVFFFAPRLTSARTFAAAGTSWTAWWC